MFLPADIITAGPEIPLRLRHGLEMPVPGSLAE
jgi:hypothetical protein